MLKNYRLAVAVLWSTFLAGILQAMYFYPLLPNNVASHFNALGKADRFSQKNDSLIVEMLLLLGITLLFYALAKYLHKFSTDLIHLPQKEYWLSPERREQTFIELKSMLLWFGIETNIFLLVTFQNVIQANITGSNKISPLFFIILAFYLLAVLGTTIYIAVYFSRTKEW